MKNMRYTFSMLLVLSLSSSCSNVPGPDKSLEGALLAAGWGAGAGAVIGNQTGAIGPGTAIGAGFGAVAGLLTGLGLDVQEGFSLQQQREIDSLSVQVAANRRELREMQASFDDRKRMLSAKPSGTSIWFDTGRASLHMGSALQLERLADAVKLNPYVGAIELHGHTEDLGSEDKNTRLSELRARTVATFLTEHGVSSHVLKIIPHGASQPIGGNQFTEGKQQNNRVEIVLLK